MKVLIFADIHGHNFREFSYIDDDGFNSRLIEQAIVLNNIHRSGVKHKVDQVWFLGDLTHLKNNIDTQVIRSLMLEMMSIAGSFPVWVIPGNHDYRLWSADPALLQMLQDGEERIHVAQSFNWHGIDGKTRLRIMALPYTRSLAGLNEDIEALDSDPSKDIFLGHQDIIGVNYGKFIVQKGLDADVLSRKFRLSLIGHYHNRKQVRKNVLSVGAPMQHNFGDAHQSRGWWILDTDTYELEFIENDFSPRFWKIKTSDENEPQDLPGDPEKDYYWVTVKGSKLPDRFKPIRWKRVNFDIENTTKDRIDMKLSDSTDDIIEKYVKAKNPHGLDNDKLIEIGRRYL